MLCLDEDKRETVEKKKMLGLHGATGRVYSKESKKCQSN
jgi:hypothetical protein